MYNIQIESKEGNLTPDIKGYNGKEVIWIEIANTHKSEKQKINYVKENNVSLIEIDVSEFKYNFDSEQFEMIYDNLLYSLDVFMKSKYPRLKKWLNFSRETQKKELSILKKEKNDFLFNVILERNKKMWELEKEKTTALEEIKKVKNLYKSVKNKEINEELKSFENIIKSIFEQLKEESLGNLKDISENFLYREYIIVEKESRKYKIIKSINEMIKKYGKVYGYELITGKNVLLDDGFTYGWRVVDYK